MFETQFKNLISKVLVKPNLLETYQAQDQTKESAVAIILRNTSKYVQDKKRQKLEELQGLLQYFLETQLLFLQRVTNQKAFSGDVCLPGGKIQTKQTPLQAAIRETKQQTNLELKEQELLGMVNNKFIAFQQGTFYLYTSVFVFFINTNEPIKLNHDQMTDYKWISLKHFLNEENYTYQKIENRFGSKFQEVQNFYKYVDYIEWPSINVGLSKTLYGLTLYILGYFVNRLISSIIDLYTRFCQIQVNIRNNHDKINHERRQKFYRAKVQLEYCLTSAIRFKNIYFVNWRLVFKENAPFTDKQKSLYESQFVQHMKVFFPSRPRF